MLRNNSAKARLRTRADLVRLFSPFFFRLAISVVFALSVPILVSLDFVIVRGERGGSLLVLYFVALRRLAPG